MGSKSVGYDDQAAAKLVLQLKSIATKEVAKIPPSCIDALFQDASMEGAATSADSRQRTVSVESVDMVCSYTVTPVLSCIPKALAETKSFLLDDDDDDGSCTNSSSSTIDHHDWSDRVVFSPTMTKREPSSSGPIKHPLLCSPNDIIKQCKKKRESFVGLTTKAGSVRATLRKKVGITILDVPLVVLSIRDKATITLAFMPNLLLVSPNSPPKVFVEVLPRGRFPYKDSISLQGLISVSTGLTFQHPSLSFAFSWKTTFCRTKTNIFSIQAETTPQNRYVTIGK